jgi:hypothetical protein
MLTAAAGGPPAAPAPVSDYLCPPRLQLRHPELCPATGPGAALAQLAETGLYPAMPLPTTPLDPRMFYVPTEYLRAGKDPVRLFPSPEAAARGSGDSGEIPEGFVYLYYTDAIPSGDGTVYATSGGYVRSGDASDFKPQNYHGQAFSHTPERPFCWVISGTFTSTKPGGEALTDHWLSKFDVVQIYDVQHAGEWDWYQVGRDEWIEQRNVARVVPDTAPPPGVDADKWITVNLYEQTVSAYQDGRLVYATMVSTGRNGFWTRPGLFQVWAKLERDLMTGGIPGEAGFYHLENVPWVLYFDKARALHGTYWQAKFGTTTSRGCVNLPMTDAQWFYDFAEEGTYVYVFDPSGETPTDEASYGEGGA